MLEKTESVSRFRKRNVRQADTRRAVGGGHNATGRAARRGLQGRRESTRERGQQGGDSLPSWCGGHLKCCGIQRQPPVPPAALGWSEGRT